MDSQKTLKQPTRSGKLLVGMPALIATKKKATPICDGRCTTACGKCLRKRAVQAGERSARAEKRGKWDESDIKGSSPAAAPSEPKMLSLSDSDSDDELFDEWAPGRVRATPERPTFTPSPQTSPSV